MKMEMTTINLSYNFLPIKWRNTMGIFVTTDSVIRGSKEIIDKLEEILSEENLSKNMEEYNIGKEQLQQCSCNYCGLLLMQIGVSKDEVERINDCSAFIVDFDRVDDEMLHLSTEDKNGLAKGFYKKLIEFLEVSIALKSEFINDNYLIIYDPENYNDFERVILKVNASYNGMESYDFNDSNVNQEFEFDKYANDIKELEEYLEELDLVLEEVLALKDENDINYFELIKGKILKTL